MKIAFISASLLASSAALAAIPVDGWYGSLFGGFSYLPDNVSTTRYGFVFDNTAYNAGYTAGGNIGYKSNPIRYEGELSYIHGDTKRFDVNGFRQGGVFGHSQAGSLMANIYYDFPEVVPAIEPYLGVGLGYGFVNGELRSAGPFVPHRLKGSNSVFAYQAMTGLSYNFAENYSVFAGYRYFGTDRVNKFNKVFQAHMALAGVTYRCDTGSYK